MQQPQVHNFLERYFTANQCKIVSNGHNYLTVQLSMDMDKLIMNRPFYWHYLEKTGGIPQPMELTLITDQTNIPKEIKGESVYFGSPRLHQLFQTTRDLGGYIRLYEQINVSGHHSTPLHPWLCLNIKITFQCDRKKDVILSLGLNLIHGQIVQQFYDKLCERELTPKIPDFCFTMSPLITIKSGLVRMKKLIQTYVNNEDDLWAKAAIKRLQADLDLLEKFYENDEEKPESYHIEKEALHEQYEPNIHISIINGGMFYLEQQVF